MTPKHYSDYGPVDKAELGVTNIDIVTNIQIVVSALTESMPLHVHINDPTQITS